ncbi:hypothetical protein ACHWQZ_G008618 [Mnemiopsis leidyi]
MITLTSELTAAAWWSTLLLLKLATFPAIIGLTRVGRGIFVSLEDVKYFGSGELKVDDAVVERRRRAHLNDIENILPFIGLITIFAATGAGDAGCVNLISKVFTGARVIHTLVYLGEVSQPARGIAWAIALVQSNCYLQSFE